MEENNDYYDEYEIDLVKYIHLLYKNKWIIVGITFMCILLSLFVSFFILEEEYKSELTFIAPNFELVTGENLSKDEYINFFQRDQIKKDIRNEFYPEEDYPELKNNFLDKNFQITREEESNFIKLNYIGGESEKTALVLNQWFKSFENELYNYLDTNNSNYLNSLKSKTESDYQVYISNLEKYDQFKIKNNISLLKSRLNRKENRLVRIEEKILDNSNSIIKKNAELDSVNNQLLGIDKFLVKKESITNKSLNKLKSINPDQTLINLLTTENEFLNPQYSILMNKRNLINQQISVVKSDLKNNKTEIKQLNTEIIELEEKIIKLEGRKEILSNELNNSRGNYQTAINQYDKVQQRLAGKNYNIDLISSADINDQPESPNKKLNIAIAAVLGLMLAVFIVFFKEFIKDTDFKKYEE